MDNLISIGKILNFHGLHGEVKFGFTKGKEKQLKSLKSVLIKTVNGFTEFHILSVRFSKNIAIVKFKELNSINEVADYKGLTAFIERETFENELEEDEYLTSDLVGVKVYEEKDERLIGEVLSVTNNGATDLLNIKIKDGTIHLVPFVKPLVPKVEIESKKVWINNIDGLIPRLN